MKIDVGCGKNKRRKIGLDIDRESDADIIASALYLPIKDESMDEVFSKHFLEHFTPKEAQRLFGEFHRIVKPKGKILLCIDQDKNLERLLQKDPTHKHRYSINEIREIAEKYFDIVYIRIPKIHKKISRLFFGLVKFSSNKIELLGVRKDVARLYRD